MPEASPLYRPARSLPIELQEQCAIYFEEGLCSQSLTVLTSLLISGTSCSSANHLIPAYVPPPSFLAFLATFVVHPSTTTRAKSDDRLVTANQALQYLQNLCHIVGPINARLATAFSFRSNSKFRRRESLRKRRREEDDYVQDDDNDQVLNTKLAQEQSLWTRGESFWHVVGWAFNCATLSKARWQRWKLWLEFMFDALEADLIEQSSKSNFISAEEKEELIRMSLMAQLTTNTEGSISQHERRRAMRAVFSHGSPRDVAEFKEIWKDEMKERDIKDEKTRSKPGEPRQGLASLESDDEEDLDGMNLDLAEVKVENPGSARQTRRTTRNVKSATEDSDEVEEPTTGSMAGAIEAYGGLEAVHLRRRLLRLLCTLCNVTTAFATTDVLLDLFSEFCKPLPLPVFSIMIMPTGSGALPGTFNSSLCKELFRPLLSVTAPRFDTNHVSQDDMENRYLAATANSSTVWDNAKVSLLMEAVLWLLKDNDALKYSVRLEKAVSTGIQARQDRVKQFKIGKSNRREEDAEAQQGLKSLNASSRRLEMFVTLLQ